MLQIHSAEAGRQDQHDIILNDLACAIPVNSSAPFAGTVQYASDEALSILVAGSSKTWTETDDLHSIVRVACVAIFNIGSPPFDIEPIQAYWQDVFSTYKLAHKGWTLAGQRDYDGLVQWLDEF